MYTLCLLTSFPLPKKKKKKEKIAGTKFLLGKAKYMLGQVRSGHFAVSRFSLVLCPLWSSKKCQGGSV